jgi:hypothetical protein
MNRKAIFTILHGDSYVDTWKRYCEPGWRAYADRHGYDLVVVTEPIRLEHPLSVRPIHWQKAFIPRHPRAKDYEDIVYLDADILINYHRAPCIVSANPTGKIGAVRFDQYIDDDFNYYLIFIRQSKFRNLQERIRQHQQTPGVVTLSGPDFAAEYGQYSSDLSRPLINSGVLTMKPALHGDLLEKIYHDSFVEMSDGAETRCGQKGNFDQVYLTHKLLEADMIQLLDERYNCIAYYQMALHYPFLFAAFSEELARVALTTILMNHYFLHFAGNLSWLPLAQLNENNDLAILNAPDVFSRDLEMIKNRRGPHRFV